jgi:hypothetical protein
MDNVRRLSPAEDEPLRYNTGEWDRRARRFLLDLRLLGLSAVEIGEMLQELLEHIGEQRDAQNSEETA